MKTFRTVLVTELRLATRNVDMIVFGIIFPVIVLLVTGWVSDPEDMNANFAGIVCFGICAAGLMMLPLTIADYRHRKVLKRFRVTPTSPATLLGSSALAACGFVAVSAVATYLVARFVFDVTISGGPGRFVIAFLFVQAAIFGVGTLVGGVASNAKVANALAAGLYFPMILLSGVAVPFEVFPRPVQLAAQILPATQGVALLKGVVLGEPWTGMLIPAAILAVLGAVTYTVAVLRFRWE
ncbi:MAG: type transport system permease protein [Actinomycetota bacterium]|nr:type transport system permease protein [Actinomycetota bacterium]